METKQICVAIDLENKSEILKFLELLGSEVDIFKLHCDIINNFDDKFIQDLIRIKKKLNFKIWEDRKFADIAYITEKQIKYGIYKIHLWADIISFHSITGYDSIPIIDNLDVFLVVELSVLNHLCNTEYIEESVKIANKHPKIKGIVSQHRPRNLKKNIKIVTPGISIGKSTDGKNQKYNTIEDKIDNDIFVIGRTIIQSKNPLDTLILLKKKILK